MSKENSNNDLDKIQIHYILSKNRSGSTLLSNILNTHPNINVIPEVNIYWLLKKDYGHYKSFDEITLNSFLDDLFFILNKPGKFSSLLFPKKEELRKLINEYDEKLNFISLCKLIYTQTYNQIGNKGQITQIINKEIQFNHLTQKIYKENPKTKFIVLVRNHHANIFSSLRSKMGRNNLIFQAQKWKLEMKPLANINLPKHRILHVKYEDLILDTEQTISKICSFLGIKYFPYMVNPNNDSKNELLKSLLDENIVSKKKIKRLKKRHINSFSKINHAKINEWKKHLNEKDVEKINFICSPIAKKLDYKCNDKKTFLTIKDRYYMLLAHFDHFITCKYLLLPIKYKRILRAINIFNFFR